MLKCFCCLFCGLRLQWASSKVQVVRRRCFEVVFAAVLAHDRLTNLVHGAQVEDEMVSRLDWLVAVLANELQNTTNAS